MTTRTLTEAEALAIFADEEAGLYPRRTINEAGKAEMAAFVAANAVDADRHNLDAWYSEAEKCANDATIDESIIVEMPGRMTAGCNPATVRLGAECFDWSICE